MCCCEEGQIYNQHSIYMTYTIVQRKQNKGENQEQKILQECGGDETQINKPLK